MTYHPALCYSYPAFYNAGCRVYNAKANHNATLCGTQEFISAYIWPIVLGLPCEQLFSMLGTNQHSYVPGQPPVLHGRSSVRLPVQFKKSAESLTPLRRLTLACCPEPHDALHSPQSLHVVKLHFPSVLLPTVHCKTIKYS